MSGSDIVDRLKAASEHDEGIDPFQAQALFIEAADEIEHLRRLLNMSVQGDLDLAEPKGRA